MTTLRYFHTNDLFKFNNINLDPLTETYNLQYYMTYLAMWPKLMLVAESSPDCHLSAYIIGKAEGPQETFHGHVTALTVATEYRRQGLAKVLMNYLEHVSETHYNGWFVDLFVRASNRVAIDMYKSFGYSIYRQVVGYYSGEEDAFDMRKALARDVTKQSIIPLDPLKVSPDDVD